MKATPLAIPEIILIEPKVFGDERGFFFERFNQAQFEQAIGKPLQFVQDNHSRAPKTCCAACTTSFGSPKANVVHVVQGEVFDVTVDLRKNSKTFGQWVGEILSAENKRQLWIPEGFAHGFVVLSDTAEFLYKTTNYYAPAHERCILWSDATLAIQWPAGIQPILSAKDALGKSFIEAEVFV